MVAPSGEASSSGWSPTVGTGYVYGLAPAARRLVVEARTYVVEAETRTLVAE